ncbi:MAG TPA: hypothetical protein VGU71_14040 [Candidatus Dormibacteraeota bacterium]|nr:hypothetical protein [Candidatus Dormibacteraeota bacterium]
MTLPPEEPGKVGRWWWDGLGWVPAPPPPIARSAGSAEQTAIGFWSPHRPWSWNGRQWVYAFGSGSADPSELANATSFTLLSMPAAPPAPEVSGDGEFYWDGTH